jgi:hypothetical protein
MTNYPEGTVVTVKGTFTNTAGAVQDPATVKLTVVTPDGVEATYVYGTDADMLKSSTGVYTCNLDTTAKRGLWLYTWWSVGSGQADSGEKEFYVE